jgi:hypothetical protein
MIIYGRRREFLISQGEADDVDLLETGSQRRNDLVTYP